LSKTNDSAYGSPPALGRRCGGNFKHKSALSRRAAPEAVPICFSPEGVRNADAQCTRSLVCKVRVAHELETARHRKHPAFPYANGFNGLLRALPGDRALLPPPFAGKPATWMPASGHQDHTPSPSAPFEKATRRFWYQPAEALAKADQHHSSFDAAASIASRSQLRDDRETPLCGTGWRELWI
jgi:hypothetical protein